MKNRRLLSKRTLWAALFGLLLLVWLVPAGFVVLYDPAATHAPLPGEGLVPSGRSEFFRFSHGYAVDWSVSTSEGDDDATADKTTTTDGGTTSNYHVERGTLDRGAGTFPFGISCSLDHAQDIEGLVLSVTSRSDWSLAPETVWTRVATARVASPGSASANLSLRARVPASTTAYRVQELRGGVPSAGFGQPMLTAPTFLGRAYDRIAWLPAFRWLPDVR